MSQPADRQNILLIDDSESDRAQVRASLLQGNPARRYHFREATNALEGLALCRHDPAWPIDCVIVDVHMPGMSGVQLVRELQHQEGYPRLPVIVLTGSSGVPDAEEALSAGAQDYLPKEAVRPEIMPRIVDNAIARHGMVVRLHESERNADSANQSKSAFIANMSHEIRTPMTAVLGYAALLEERESDPEKAEFIQTIKRNGRFLLELINEILDVSKIEAGRMELEAVAFAPHQLVAEVVEMMRVRAREKQLTFEAEAVGSLPAEIESDPRRLKQILVNLIGNAIKFTEHGTVRVEVSFRKDPTARLQFTVSDTGIGMNAEQQARLFQPFSQGDASVNRRFGGTGLGLTISQRLAAMLGGEITFESEPDAGSTFRVCVAVPQHSRSMLIQPTLDPVDDTTSQQDDPRRLHCRVLVVDDRRDVRFLTSHFLTKAGAEVELAEDGQEGLNYVRQVLRGEAAPVDLILLDMQMPRLDGYQTAVSLREMGFHKPIIALTADAMHGDMSRCIECGCDSYLSKPIDSTRLVKTVAAYTQHVNRRLRRFTDRGNGDE